MKILIIHNTYISQHTGGEDIVFYNELTALEERLGKNSVYHYTVSNNTIHIPLLIFTIFFSIRHFFAVRRLIKREKINLVHVHNFFPLLTTAVFLAARISGAKTVHTLHNYRLWCPSGTFYRDGFGICEKCAALPVPIFCIRYGCYRGSVLQSIPAALAFGFYNLLRMYRFIDFFFVLTRFQKEKIISLGIPPDRIILKPNFLISPGFAEATSACIPAPREGYLFVGRFEESKGLAVLLKAWKQANLPDTLYIIGSGELPEEAVAEAEKNTAFDEKKIQFLGKKTNAEVLDLMGRVKYLIQPSIWYETFGLTIIEAFLQGTPVIGFSIGTRNEFITDGKNGFLAEPDNLPMVLKNSSNRSDYEELSRRAAEKGAEFSRDTILGFQITAYQKILNGKAKLP